METNIIKIRRIHGTRNDRLIINFDSHNWHEKLNEDINENNKNELFKAYYFFMLGVSIDIEDKNEHGQSSVFFQNIKNIQIDLSATFKVLQGKISSEEIVKNIDFINKLSGLSEKEIISAMPLKEFIMLNLNDKNENFLKNSNKIKL